jgi:tRNA(adenine34) deaminase
MAEFDDEYYMQKALLLAAKAAELGEVPVGAVIVENDVVIGEGWNQPIASHDPTAHAELVALRAAAQQKANYRLPTVSVYVTLEPCTMCLGAMVHARVGRLVYGAREPKSGVIESNGSLLNADYLNHQLEVCGGVLAPQCSALLSDFFKQRRLQAKAAKKS